MDAIDSFSDEAGDLMEEVYQHDAKVLSLLDAWKGEREA